jgi:hypothetical protein
LAAAARTASLVLAVVGSSARVVAARVIGTSGVGPKRAAMSRAAFSAARLELHTPVSWEVELHVVGGRRSHRRGRRRWSGTGS